MFSRAEARLEMARNDPQRRSALVFTARELFYTRGYERTSINDIVAAAGVSKGAFYHYFDSKHAVLVAVVESLVAATRALIEPIIDDPQLEAIAKLRELLTVLNSWKVERKVELIALTRTLRSDDNAPLRSRMERESKARLVPLLADIIAQGVAEGSLDVGLEPGPSHATAQVVFTVMRGFSDALADIVLEPEAHADPAAEAHRCHAAAQVALARILGAPPGSFSLIDTATITAWLA